MTCRVALNIAKHAVAAGAAHMNDQPDEETDDPSVSTLSNAPDVAGYSAKNSSISSTIRQWRQGRSWRSSFSDIDRSYIAPLGLIGPGGGAGGRGGRGGGGFGLGLGVCAALAADLDIVTSRIL